MTGTRCIATESRPMQRFACHSCSLRWCYRRICEVVAEERCVVGSNPQKTHYFEKQTLDTTSFSTDCPVCKKSLLTGIVDSIYKCKVCGMAVHGNCRERAKFIFRCIPPEQRSQNVGGEDLSEKVLRSIKKDRLLVYDQAIGRLCELPERLTCRVVQLNQITLFNLKNKHKSLYLVLSCDVVLRLCCDL